MSLNTRQPNTLLSKFGKYADNLIMYRIAFSIPPPRASSGYQISGQISSWPDIQSKPDIQPDFFVNIQLLKYTNLVTFLYHHHILSCYSLFFFHCQKQKQKLVIWIFNISGISGSQYPASRISNLLSGWIPDIEKVRISGRISDASLLIMKWRKVNFFW